MFSKFQSIGIKAIGLAITYITLKSTIKSRLCPSAGHFESDFKTCLAGLYGEDLV